MKIVERNRGGGYFTCSSWIPQLSVPLGHHHQPNERLLGWVEQILSSIWEAALFNQSFCLLHGSPEGRGIFSKLPSSEKRQK